MPASSGPAQGLREKAMRAIIAGELPSTCVSRVSGGRGSGAPCALCGLPITVGQALIELSLKDGVGPSFHAGCHEAWLYACQRLTAPRGRRLR